ncbi:MAG: phosphonoacetaldehyde reductase [Elusimicrobiota bacterium]|jgi:alcohol dehydrogenase class IV|nr:phosphonoacetaldehyde reductase [Elusimicrobiota bacterium]
MIKDYGGIQDLKFYISEFKPDSVLLIHGKNSYETSGAKDAIAPYLTKLDTIQWSDFKSNPQYSDMLKGAALVKQKQIDLIVAIGGGSAIDMGKLLSVYEREKEIPVIAIPTTAGTGSEATQFAVLWKEGEKNSIDDIRLLPKRSILEPRFLKKQSKQSAASPLMDALAQGIESYWSINSTGESKEYARKAIGLIIPTIKNGNLSDDDYCARMQGAHYAGKAINITRTTAAHSVSYAFTAYKNIAHGHAVMLTLPQFVKFNSEAGQSDCLDRRGFEYVRKTINETAEMFDCLSVDDVVKKLQDFMDILGLERKLKNLGFSNEKDFQYIIDNGFNPQRVKNNPRLLTKESLNNILKSAVD